MFASVTGCMSWDAVKASHWTGRAFWESSLIFAICAILTGAQQTLYLGTSTLVAQLNSREIRELKSSLASRGNKSAVQKACPLVVFAWQAPLMLLCYAVVCFLAGLCSIVYSPLVRALQWNADARVCTRSDGEDTKLTHSAGGLALQHRGCDLCIQLGNGFAGSLPLERPGTDVDGIEMISELPSGFCCSDAPLKLRHPFKMW